MEACLLQDKHKIWLYRDKGTGEPKGDCTVTYEDPFTAASAVNWFNDQEFQGAQGGLYSIPYTGKGSSASESVRATSHGVAFRSCMQDGRIRAHAHSVPLCPNDEKRTLLFLLLDSQGLLGDDVV